MKKSKTRDSRVSVLVGRLGQASVEYLTSYGWIFLIIFLAIAAAAYVGLVNPNTYVPEECNIQGDLVCVDKYLAVDGNLTLLIKNNYPVTIDIVGGVLLDGQVIDCQEAHVPVGSVGKLRCFLYKEFSEGDKFRIDYKILWEKDGGITGTYYSNVNVLARAEESIDVDQDCVTQGAVDTCVFPQEYCGDATAPYMQHSKGVPTMSNNPYVIGPALPLGKNEWFFEEFIQCCSIPCKTMPSCNAGIDSDYPEDKGLNQKGCAGFQGGDMDCESGGKAFPLSNRELEVPGGGCKGCIDPTSICMELQYCPPGYMPDDLPTNVPVNCNPSVEFSVCCIPPAGPPPV